MPNSNTFHEAGKQQEINFLVPVGTKLQVGNQMYRYVKMNDVGVPYFVKVNKGKDGKRMYTLFDRETAREKLLETLSEVSK